MKEELSNESSLLQELAERNRAKEVQEVVEATPEEGSPQVRYYTSPLIRSPANRFTKQALAWPKFCSTSFFDYLSPKHL